MIHGTAQTSNDSGQDPRNMLSAGSGFGKPTIQAEFLNKALSENAASTAISKMTRHMNDDRDRGPDLDMWRHFQNVKYAL